LYVIPLHRCRHALDFDLPACDYATVALHYTRLPFVVCVTRYVLVPFRCRVRSRRCTFTHVLPAFVPLFYYARSTVLFVLEFGCDCCVCLYVRLVDATFHAFAFLPHRVYLLPYGCHYYRSLPRCTLPLIVTVRSVCLPVAMPSSRSLRYTFTTLLPLHAILRRYVAVEFCMRTLRVRFLRVATLPFAIEFVRDSGTF